MYRVSEACKQAFFFPSKYTVKNWSVDRMSDLFVSEILILLLLIPVLLRPFFRRLQVISGIAILPLLSLLLSMGVFAAGGFRFSFLPVFICVFLVFIFNFVRMVHLFTGLPSDWYSTSSIIQYVLLIIIFFGTVWCAVFFAPEQNRISENEISRTFYTQSFSLGTGVRFSVWKSARNKTNSSEGLVIIMSDSATGSGARNSTASVLSENGYIVVEGNSISSHDYISPLYLYPGIRKAFFLIGRIFPNLGMLPSKEEITMVQDKSLERFVSWTRKEYGDTLPLYVIAEGDSLPSVASKFSDNPSLFAGIICISNNSEVSALFPQNSQFNFNVTGGSLPSSSYMYPVCIFSGSEPGLDGLGEIAANDVLLTFILGGSRDKGRMHAELIARRIMSWIQMRSVYGFEGS